MKLLVKRDAISWETDNMAEERKNCLKEEGETPARKESSKRISL